MKPVYASDALTEGQTLSDTGSKISKVGKSVKLKGNLTPQFSSHHDQKDGSNCLGGCFTQSYHSYEVDSDAAILEGTKNEHLPLGQSTVLEKHKNHFGNDLTMT